MFAFLYLSVLILTYLKQSLQERKNDKNLLHYNR